jgi:16S rRNA (guanine527-N7)-methyltransferase
MKWDQFASEAESLGAPLDGDQVAAFEIFEERLYKANETKNLTGVPREDCRGRHFLDSLSVARLIPTDSSVLDIGTGAGFPGVPLAIARPDLKVTLLDAASKEIAFLETLSDIATFGLILQRAEIAGRDAHFRERYDVTVGRAVAPLSIQAEVSTPFVRVGGSFLPQRAENEVAASFHQLGLVLEDTMSYEADGVSRRIFVYRKAEPTPERFPRTWAAMKRDAERAEG